MSEPAPSTASRRDFLKSVGTLTMGFSLWGACWSGRTETAAPLSELPGNLRRYPRINAWLEVLEDGKVRILTGKVELGQGIRIAIKQVAAEELQMGLDQLEIVMAETDRTPDEGYTSGSGSIQGSAMAVRYAAAAAREKLLALAAAQLGVPAGELICKNGHVLTPSGKSLHFAQILNGQQIEDEVKLPVKLIDKKDYRYVGKAVSRDDLGKIVRGEPIYVQDLRFPDMLYAGVLRPKNYQSQLLAFDEAAFRAAAQNVVQTLRNGSFLAALTTSSWEAIRATKLLAKHSQWSAPSIFPDRERLAEHIQQHAVAPQSVKEVGTPELSHSLKARYFKPYHMHGSMGPACAVALWDEQTLHVWTHSQGIYPLRDALAAMLGMRKEQLHLIGVPGAGCFGHTVADDAAADAALLALSLPGRHIQVQWSRQDENAWEPYGSAMLMQLEASLDANGKIHSWRSDIWTDSHSTRPNREAATVLAARHLQKPFVMESRGYLGGGHRNGEPYYQIPHQKIQAHFFDGPLRVSSVRSLGAFANVFAIESFMDQLADKAGQDPMAFRIAHLDDERAIAVLKAVQKMTRRTKVGANEGIGFAFSRYKNNTSYAAVAVRVAVDPERKTIRLQKCWAALDVGEVINALGLRQQAEGSMVQAASWALMESVQFDDQQITSLDWANYPIFRLADSPELEVMILDRPDQPAMGGGEFVVPPVGAAIANAVYRACGQRLYDLPLRLG